MSIRSLFNIILKVLGIFFIKDILETLPQLIAGIFYLNKSDIVGESFWTLISIILIFLVYVLVAYYLIFRSEFIIDRLKLNSGLEQDTIALNLHRSAILSISIIVIGGLIMVNEIPNLLRQLFFYYQEKRMTYGQTNPSISYSIASAAKIIIGLLLIGNQRQIVNFIELKRKN